MDKSLALLVCLASVCFAAQTRNFDVTTVIQSRFAETTISSTVFNNKGRADEIKFQSILPKEAYITSFSMEIDGVTYDGVIEEKEEAEQTFEKLKAKNKTAGIVRTRDESIKTFKTSVNIGAGKEVTFKLVYQQLLRKTLGKYLSRIILLGNQLTERLSINVYICEASTITNVTVPPSITADGDEVNPSVNIVMEDNFAHIEYLPANSNDPLIEAFSKSGGSFSVEYSLAVDTAGDIVIDGNYFLHFFDPSAKDGQNETEVSNLPKPRRIVFVLDSSGSMSGNKVNQMKDAMKSIVRGLNEQDRINVIDFDTGIKPSFTNIVPVTTDNQERAVQFIGGLVASGGTNIYGAMETAMDMMNDDLGAEIISANPATTYIVFLTDGQGNGPASAVLENMRTKNTKGVAIHAIGFGTGVNADFLKTLAAQNKGTWRQIFEDTDASLQIQDYLNELGFTLVDGGLSITYPDIFLNKLDTGATRIPEGGELLTVGRFKRKAVSESESYFVNVKNGKNKERNATFTITDAPPTCAAVAFKKLKNYGFKAFGILQITEILRQMDATFSESEKERLKNEAIALSLKYKLVTPVTAMLVITPEDRADLEAEEKAKEAERKRKEQEAKDKAAEAVEGTAATPTETTNAAVTEEQTTKAGWNDTDPWWSTNGDPHFMVHLSNNITACFNWLGNDGDIYNLLTDSKNEVVVNGMLKDAGAEKNHAMYISTIAILSIKYNVVVMVEPKKVLVRDFSSQDKRTQDLVIPVVDTHSFETIVGRIRFAVSSVTKAHTILNITIDDSVSFLINLHHYDGEGHLDFVIQHTSGFADHISGIFGSFPKEAKHGAPLASLDTLGQKHLLWFHDQLIPVELKAMDVPTIHRKMPCWFVAHAKGILGHPLDYYQLNRIYDIPEYMD